MRVHALLCVRDEAHRYLDCVLSALEDQVDSIVVFDDRSTDATRDIALRFTPLLCERPHDVPSFLEHEGRFREASWRALDQFGIAEDGDWVLSVDADELLITAPGVLERTLKEADARDDTAVRLMIPEVFSLSPLAVRQDGWWANLAAPRLIRWQPAAVFPDKPMACGSAPVHARFDQSRGLVALPAPNELCLLHLGYAHEDDRREKWARYRGRSGHAVSHVESIMTPPHLAPWPYPTPPIWRGTR